MSAEVSVEGYHFQQKVQPMRGERKEREHVTAQGRYGGFGPLDFFLILTVVGELKGRHYVGDLDVDGNII